MSRTNSRKRTLSPDVPECIPVADSETVAVQRECLPPVQPTVHGGSCAPKIGGNGDPDVAGSTNVTGAAVPPETLGNNEGQRDLLVNLLREAQVNCMICFDRAKNTEPVWSCRSCYQILHLKCVTVWYVKSHESGAWRCPACQSRFLGIPRYFCFCGSLRNPRSNDVDLPHSCGQICAQRKKNSNPDYDDCRHKCTLLCHPGPCPKCTEQVTRKCACTKTEFSVQCGQSTPVLCSRVCQKTLTCKKHVCQKRCHAKECGPCKSASCPKFLRIDPNRDPVEYLQIVPGASNDPRVTDEELRALGLNPEEFVQIRPHSARSTRVQNEDTEDSEDDDPYENMLMDSTTSSDSSSNQSLDHWSDDIPGSNVTVFSATDDQVLHNFFPNMFSYTTRRTFPDDSSDTDTDNGIVRYESDRIRMEERANEMFIDDNDSMENEESENYNYSSGSSDSSQSAYTSTSSHYFSSDTSSSD